MGNLAPVTAELSANERRNAARRVRIAALAALTPEQRAQREATLALKRIAPPPLGPARDGEDQATRRDRQYVERIMAAGGYPTATAHGWAYPAPPINPVRQEDRDAIGAAA